MLSEMMEKLEQRKVGELTKVHLPLDHCKHIVGVGDKNLILL